MSERIDLKRVVMKLNGPVEPAGETNADAHRLENLQALIELTDELVDELRDVARHIERYEHSMKLAGTTAANALYELALKIADCNAVHTYERIRRASQQTPKKPDAGDGKSLNHRSLDGEIPSL